MRNGPSRSQGLTARVAAGLRYDFTHEGITVSGNHRKPRLYTWSEVASVQMERRNRRGTFFYRLSFDVEGRRDLLARTGVAFQRTWRNWSGASPEAIGALILTAVPAKSLEVAVIDEPPQTQQDAVAQRRRLVLQMGGRETRRHPKYAIFGIVFVSGWEVLHWFGFQNHSFVDWVLIGALVVAYVWWRWRKRVETEARIRKLEDWLKQHGYPLPAPEPPPTGGLRSAGNDAHA